MSKPTWRVLKPVIIEKYGNVNDIALHFGVKRRTVHNWASKDPSGKIKIAFNQARQRLLDIAETKLTSKIIEGNLTSIIFYLKTQGKARGWVEKVDQQISGELNLTIDEHVITKPEDIKK